MIINESNFYQSSHSLTTTDELNRLGFDFKVAIPDGDSGYFNSNLDEKDLIENGYRPLVNNDPAVKYFSNGEFKIELIKTSTGYLSIHPDNND